MTSCASTHRVVPPVAKKKPRQLVQNGDVRFDNYYWMRDRENPQVIDYLNAENDYTREVLKPIEGLRKNLLDEMVARIKKNDSSVPVLDGDYYYYRMYEESSEHPIYVRKKSSLNSEENIILDANKLAKGQKYFKLGGYAVSANHQVLAYASDTVGRRIFNIEFVDLRSGNHLPYKIESVTSNFTFAEDNTHLFYVKQNPETLRYESVYMFNYKTGKHKLVFHEKDTKYNVWVYKSRSKEYVIVSTGSSESDEVHLIDALKPTTGISLFSKRRKKHEYSIDHAGSYFIVRSNKGAENFKLFRTPDLKNTSEKHWYTLLEHRDDVLLNSTFAFKDYIVNHVRKNGVLEIEILDRKTNKLIFIPQPEPSHVVHIDQNPNYDITQLRYSYASLTQPHSIIDYNLKTGTKITKKVEEVLGGYRPDNYVSKRTYATAPDGVKIPISLVYRKDVPLNGSAPLLLYGYGSYGYSTEPYFSRTRLSLLERGFVYAIAHIRGGSEMGRRWYLDGKFLNKKNTFTDFIVSGDFLIEKKYADPDRIYAMGGSAGGLLMGSVINMRPKLFKGIVALVPFVDVLTTMLDESIPLTTEEFEEWGNPKDPKYYDYIKSYSPYDNIEAKEYPPMLVGSGLHDSQVQYWEPTKWVAKLRAYKTGNNILLLDTNMEAGHGGKSGRFKQLEDTARNYAFLLYLAGLSE